MNLGITSTMTTTTCPYRAGSGYEFVDRYHDKMAAAENESTSSGKTMEESSSSFFQLSLNTQESSTRVGVLGVKIKPTKTENVSQYFCDICKVYLNSQIQSAAHYQGKSHQNKVKSAEKIAEAIEAIQESSNSVSCTVSI